MTTAPNTTEHAASSTSSAAGAAVVAVAFHDGFYSAGTGAGRSNRVLIDTIAVNLSSAVRLLLLPVRLDTTSPEYSAALHQNVLRRLAAVPVPYEVIELDNGTHGQQRFGDLTAFQQLTQYAGKALTRTIATHHRGLLLVIDQPYAGLSRVLPPSPPGWTYVYLPRSFADRHVDPERARWEQAGIDAWTRLGARLGAISMHMRDLLSSIGVPDSRIIDVPGGLTAADDVPLSSAPNLPRGIDADAGFLLSMGRAQPYKGFDDLLQALAILLRAGHTIPHLLLAAVTESPGTTPYQDHLERTAQRLGVPATIWTRFDPGLPGLLHHPRLRAVLVPSRREPLGRIPLEAFAAGAGPVVATTAGGLAETVLDGITGFTASPGDPPAFAAAIARALTVTPSELDRLRAAGTDLASRRDYTNCVTRLLAETAPWAVSPGTSHSAAETP